MTEQPSRRLRTDAERSADAWRATAASRPGFVTYPGTAAGDPSWWRRDVPGVEPEPSPSFEQMLSDPHGQFDPDGELLPHLMAFGPVRDDRPWLFQPAASTTAVPVDGETCKQWCGYCHLEPDPLPERIHDGSPGPLPPVPDSAYPPCAVPLPEPPQVVVISPPPRRRWWHRLTRRNP